ncbi:MAG: hypothetical protein DYG98_01015 [Haliscomenobacteraceae bacterium CHB4]|nr:hypothetical protein [Haliscomenobacteraceae bacterium CHB4]
MENTSTTPVLREFSTAQWQHWTEDILHLNTAYPISYFSPDDEPADVLSKMIAYLQENDISTRPYEEAINELLHKYHKEQFNAPKLHALLSAVMSSGSFICKTYVLRLFDSRLLAPLENKGFSLHALTLQALTKMNLTDAERSKVLASTRALLLEMQPRADIYAQSLYFARNQDDLNHPLAGFFDWMTLMFQVLEKNPGADPAHLCPKAIRMEVLSAAVSRKGDFFPAFYHWFKANDEMLSRNIAYLYVLSGLCQWLEEKPERWQANEYTNALLFLLLAKSLLPRKKSYGEGENIIVQAPAEVMEFLIQSNQMKKNRIGWQEGLYSTQTSEYDIFWYTSSITDDFIFIGNGKQSVKIYDETLGEFFCDLEANTSPQETLMKKDQWNVRAGARAA